MSFEGLKSKLNNRVKSEVMMLNMNGSRQDEIASKLGVSRATVNAIINGRANITIEGATSYLGKLGVQWSVSSVDFEVFNEKL